MGRKLEYLRDLATFKEFKKLLPSIHHQFDKKTGIIFLFFRPTIFGNILTE